jgi:hypothetical protein
VREPDSAARFSIDPFDLFEDSTAHSPGTGSSRCCSTRLRARLHNLGRHRGVLDGRQRPARPVVDPYVQHPEQPADGLAVKQTLRPLEVTPDNGVPVSGDLGLDHIQEDLLVCLI